MDPNTCLAEIRHYVDAYKAGMRFEQQLIDLIDSLDEWLSNGGFPPDAWR